MAPGYQAGLAGKLDSAWNLVGVHDLETLLGAFWVLGSNQSAEPEDSFLNGVET